MTPKETQLVKYHEKRAIAIMLTAFQNHYFYFLPEGLMGGFHISDRERVETDSALNFLYENGFGKRGSSRFDFTLTNEGVEFLEKLNLVDDEELTEIGNTILLLAYPQEFKPPMKATAPSILNSIKQKLSERADLSQLAAKLHWDEQNELEEADYNKLNKILKKQFRELYIDYTNNLDYSKVRENFQASPVVSLNIENFSNYGLMNAGTMSDIQSINFNIQAIKNENEKLGEGIRLLTEAVNVAELPEEYKERAIDSLNELSSEIAKPGDQRRSWKVKDKIEKMTSVINASAVAFESFEKLKPHIDNVIQAAKTIAGL